MKRLLLFDLDGTLTKSRQAVDEEMSSLLVELLHKTKVAVISGGPIEQFHKQLVNRLGCDDVRLLESLYLFPTCATSFYRYKEDRWLNVYSEKLSDEEVKGIKSAINYAVHWTNTFPETEQIWGEQIENRGTQVTFSALGQNAPLEMKSKWDADQSKRKKIKKVLEKIIPEFEVRLGGNTSIDVTKKGIDKTYAIQQIDKHLGIKKRDMVFIGDALYEGGNDSPMLNTGIPCVSVKDEEETKVLMRRFLNGESIGN